MKEIQMENSYLSTVSRIMRFTKIDLIQINFISLSRNLGAIAQ